MRNEYVITHLRKQIELDPEPIIQMIKEYGPGGAAKILRCSEGWLTRNVRFDYMGYYRSLHPPMGYVRKRPDHKGVGNTNGLKTKSDDNGRECTGCGIYKLWSEYRKNPQGHRGHSPTCKLCQSSYNKSKKSGRVFV